MASELKIYIKYTANKFISDFKLVGVANILRLSPILPKFSEPLPKISQLWNQ